jgi:predicted DCC family thiol-disulfide oxidoreductase YuxK
VNAENHPTANNPARTVVFFDGVCGMCNALVDFLIARDHARRLLYAPLQGETFQALARAQPELAKIDSLVISQQTAAGKPAQIYIRSRGALVVLGELGGGWRMLSRILRFVPAPLSDLVYRFIARVRYRVFGKHAACRLPTAEERALFLP